MSNNKSKDKGTREENNLVKKLNSMGIKAKRIPLSGACKEYPGDIEYVIDEIHCLGEVKVRKTGFTKLYDWLKGNDALFIKQVSAKDKGRQFLVVIPLETFCSF